MADLEQNGGQVPREDDTTKTDNNTESTNDPIDSETGIDWQSEAKKLRKESASYRTQLRQVQQELEQIKGGNDESINRAKEQIQKLQAELDSARRESRNARIASAASQMGFYDPDDAARLLDIGEEDDDIVGALKKLVKQKPHLIRTQSVDAGATGGTQPKTLNDLLRAARGR